MISLHTIGYLIIFLPLISCFLCLLISVPKSSFLICATTNFIVGFLALALIFLIPNFNTHVISTVSERIMSVGINYDIGFLGLVFIALIAFIQFIAVIFYKRILIDSFNDYSRRLFYAISSLNLFAILGIFTNDNIINLYLFIEIYSVTFYAISCSSKEKSLNRLAFRYFYQGSVGSLLILISLFCLFINFDSASFHAISLGVESLYKKGDYLLMSCIFIIFITGITFKFFPFWLYLDNIKSYNPLSHLFLLRLLLVKANIGFYLILKFLFFLFKPHLAFDILSLDIILLTIAVLLISYSNIKILRNNNFKVIITNYCLIYFGFFLASLSIEGIDALIGAMAFIFHYSLIGLLLMLISSYMAYNFNTCNIKNLNLLKGRGVLVPQFFKISIPLICAFPLTFLFLANWQLTYASLEFNYVIIILIPMFTTFFVFANLGVKMMSYFYFNPDVANRPNSLNNLQDNIYYLVCFVLVILVILLFSTIPKATLDIFRNLSLYLT